MTTHFFCILGIVLSVAGCGGSRSEQLGGGRASATPTGSSGSEPILESPEVGNKALGSLKDDSGIDWRLEDESGKVYNEGLGVLEEKQDYWHIDKPIAVSRNLIKKVSQRLRVEFKTEKKYRLEDLAHVAFRFWRNGHFEEISSTFEYSKKQIVITTSKFFEALSDQSPGAVFSTVFELTFIDGRKLNLDFLFQLEPVTPEVSLDTIEMPIPSQLVLNGRALVQQGALVITNTNSVSLRTYIPRQIDGRWIIQGKMDQYYQESPCAVKIKSETLSYEMGTTGYLVAAELLEKRPDIDHFFTEKQSQVIDLNPHETKKILFFSEGASKDLQSDTLPRTCTLPDAKVLNYTCPSYCAKRMACLTPSFGPDICLEASCDPSGKCDIAPDLKLGACVAEQTLPDLRAFSDTWTQRGIAWFPSDKLPKLEYAALSILAPTESEKTALVKTQTTPLPTSTRIEATFMKAPLVLRGQVRVETPITTRPGKVCW